METSAPLLGEPAPVELMNTVWADRDGVYDTLADPDAAAAWLRATGLRTGPADLDRLRRLRDALRRLAAEVTGDPREPAPVVTRAEAVEVLNEACALAPTWSELTWPTGGEPTRVTRVDRAPADRALAAVAEQAAELFAGPDRDRLRACLAPGCVLYFVREHPRREWCSPGCGNRARVARHYRRHHRETAGVSPRTPG